MAKTHLPVVELASRVNVYGDTVVLCVRFEDDTKVKVREFVTWKEFDGSYFHGHYYSNSPEGLEAAITDFNRR